jgi:hypothetical protein
MLAGWFIPIILATWETEIGRIKIWGQPEQDGLWDPHLQNNQEKNGLEVWLKW